MKKSEITRRYNELISKIETAKIYDGRNTMDKYVCIKCGSILLTTYADKGVTPLVTRCDKCGAWMEHKNTYELNKDIIVEKWVRPTLQQALMMNDSALDHLFKGGLFLEKELTNLKKIKQWIKN